MSRPVFKIGGMKIRRFAPGDEPALLAVFYSAVHQTAARDYSPAQLAAWAPDYIDGARWAEHMRALRPFVAEQGGQIVGYADVQPNGYIDHFFVCGRHARQGIGARLLQRIHAQAQTLGLTELTADVSLTAQPFFAHHGFELVERREVVRDGVTIPNALMRKRL